VDVLLLPIHDTCSLDSLTKTRRDFNEHLNPELTFYENMGVKSIQRMSVGAFELYHNRILLTKGPAKFIATCNQNWKIVACAPPSSDYSQTAVSLMDREAIEELKSHPLIIVFGHEESGIRSTVLQKASGNNILQYYRILY